MIRIEQYNQDPKRVGHELIVSLPTQRRTRPTQALNIKKPSIRDLIEGILAVQKEQGELLQKVIKLNNLKTE
jgi:hypothetical protein